MDDQIICPKCGKQSVKIQNPDQYEYWLTCSECDYFQGINRDDWHKIHNSPHLEAKLKKMFIKTHGENKSKNTGAFPCLLCKKNFHQNDIGPLKKICKTCWYKIGIIILILMVVISYSIWLLVL